MNVLIHMKKILKERGGCVSDIKKIHFFVHMMRTGI